jgi:hypothetical protein
VRPAPPAGRQGRAASPARLDLVGTYDAADRPDEQESTVNEPRLTTVMGVARAVIATVGPEDAAGVLVDEFGWDVTFQALALLRGDEARAAFGATWSSLVLDVTAAAVDAAVQPGHPSTGRELSDGLR